MQPVPDEEVRRAPLGRAQRPGEEPVAESVGSARVGWDAARGPIDHVWRNPRLAAAGRAANQWLAGNNEVYSSTAAISKIATALSRKADFVELDVASIGGTLYVSHDDPTTPGSRPKLADVLADSQFRQSSAMVFAEIKESDLAPADFASALVGALDARRQFAHNGRWLFLRASDSKISYLTALKQELSRRPFLQPYVKLSVLYDKGFGANPKTAQDRLEREVVTSGFHAVEFHFQDDNLFSLIEYARAKQMLTAVYTIPASFGDVFLAAMRDEVDILTTDYRVDYARSAVGDKNAVGYLSAAGLESGASILVRRHTGSLVDQSRTLGLPATASSFGSPAFVRNGAGAPLFGGLLAFSGADQQALQVASADSEIQAGVLVTAVVTLGSLEAGQTTQAILNKAQTGGFALEVGGGSSGPSLRFGAWPVGATAYTYHTYPAAGVPAPASDACAEAGQFTAPLTTGKSYFLIGAYHGNGGVYLWINNQCAAVPVTRVTGALAPADVPILLGADPEPDEATGARYHFTGRIQQAQTQLWSVHGGGAN